MGGRSCQEALLTCSAVIWLRCDTARRQRRQQWEAPTAVTQSEALGKIQFQSRNFFKGEKKNHTASSQFLFSDWTPSEAKRERCNQSPAAEKRSSLNRLTAGSAGSMFEKKRGKRLRLFTQSREISKRNYCQYWMR